jgi:hypothetical protein
MFREAGSPAARPDRASRVLASLGVSLIWLSVSAAMHS